MPKTIKSENKDVQKNNLNKILLVSTGLSAVAIAGIYIYKKKKLPQQNVNLTPPGSAPLNVINDFRKNINNNDLLKIDDELFNFKKNSYFVFDALGESAKNIFTLLKHTVAAEKVNVNTGTTKPPTVFAINGLEPSAFKNVSKFLPAAIDSKNASIKYNPGYMDEFFTILEDLSLTSKSNFKESQTRTFLSIDNASQLASDIKTPENEKSYSKLMGYINNPSDSHKITFLLDDINAEKLGVLPNAKHTLEFGEEVNKYDFTPDLESYKSNLNTQTMKKAAAIMDEISLNVEHDRPNTFVFLCDLMLNKPSQKNIFIAGEDEKAITKIIKLIKNVSNSFLEKIEGGGPSVKENLANLIQKGEKSQARFERTGQKTLLHIKSIENFLNPNTDFSIPENRLIKEFIETSSEKYNAIPIYSAKSVENIKSKATTIDNNLLFEIHSSSAQLETFDKSYGGMVEKFKQHDFSLYREDTENRFIKQFIPLLAQERAGLPINSKNIPNFMLIGSSKTTESFTTVLKNSLDANFEKITYNNEPKKIIQELADKMKSAEELFQKTNKRTILEVDKLDDLFTDYSTMEKRGFLGRIKGLTENSSEKFHTTILLKTDKPLEDFEEASIGGQRFGLKLFLDKKSEG